MYIIRATWLIIIHMSPGLKYQTGILFDYLPTEPMPAILKKISEVWMTEICLINDHMKLKYDPLTY